MSNRNEKARWGHAMPLNHLPPKSPSVPSNLGAPYPGCVRVPNYSNTHRRSPSASFVPDVEPSWLEELLDSPKAPERRASHRRSASDSMAFMEVPLNLRRIDDIAEEDEADSITCYDREDQLVSMFSEMNPFQEHFGQSESWSVDHRAQPTGHYHPSAGPNPGPVGKAKVSNEPEQCPEKEQQGDGTNPLGDSNSDPKKSKRQSAQRSRVRKLQYIHELEGNVNDLQNEVSTISTKVAYLEHQRLALHLENAALKQSIAALAQEKRLKDAHTEALRKEAHGLRCLQQHQQRLRQLAISSSYNVDAKHVRRASAGSVQDISTSASDVLDAFVKFTDTPLLRSSCTDGRLPGAPSLPPGFIVQNQ